jgi:hypothetical protein
MSITIKDLMAGGKSVKLTYDDFELNVEYKPSAITPTLQAEIAKMDFNSMSATVSLMIKILSGWDILGDDGLPIPIDEDTLNGLPIRLLGQINKAVFDDLAPRTQQEKKL